MKNLSFISCLLVVSILNCTPQNSQVDQADALFQLSKNLFEHYHHQAFLKSKERLVYVPIFNFLDQFHDTLAQNNLPNNVEEQLAQFLEEILPDSTTTYHCANLAALQGIKVKLHTGSTTSKTDQLILLLEFSKAILQDCIQIYGFKDVRLRLFHSDTLKLAPNRIYQIPFRLEAISDGADLLQYNDLLSINNQANTNFLRIKTNSSETSFQVDTFKLLLNHQLTGEQQEIIVTVPIQLN